MGVWESMSETCRIFSMKYYKESGIEIYINYDPNTFTYKFHLIQDDTIRTYDLFVDDIYNGKIESSEEIMHNLDILAEDLLKELEMRRKENGSA